jgi:hypothetical protein
MNDRVTLNLTFTIGGNMSKWLINMADRSAIVLSMLCVVHCLLLPVILIMLPTVTSLAFLGDERFHLWLLFAVIPISGFAVILGYFHHQSWFVIIIASTGMAILVLVALLGHEVFGEQGEIMASVLGSVFVAYGHIKNFRYRKLQEPCNQNI